MIKFYFPRWFFPDNLGDSIVSTFIPKLLKHHYNNEIEVITHGEAIIECFKKIPGVKNVRTPYEDEVKNIPEWIRLSRENNFCVYPEWHPRTWSMWGENFDKFYNHSTGNLITLSYLLQLGLEEYMLKDYDLLPCIVPNNKKPLLSKKINIAIVPADKLSGRYAPHPGCNGIGFKLNGSDGLSTWNTIAYNLKNNIDCTIYEFSKEYLNIGDVHIPHIDSYVDLATFCKGFDFAILSDGGLHHIFNSQQVPVYLLGAQKINKPYFFKLKNGYFNESLYNNCLCSSRDVLSNINGWEDLNSVCDLSCEQIDPTFIANDIIKYINETSVI